MHTQHIRDFESLAIQEDANVDREAFYDLHDSTDSFLRRNCGSSHPPSGSGSDAAGHDAAVNFSCSSRGRGSQYSAKENEPAPCISGSADLTWQQRATAFEVAAVGSDSIGTLVGAHSDEAQSTALCNASRAPPVETAASSDTATARTPSPITAKDAKEAAPSRSGTPTGSDCAADSAARRAAAAAAAVCSANSRAAREGSQRGSVAATPAAVEVATERYLGMAQAVQPPLAAEALALRALQLAVEDRVACHRRVLVILRHLRGQRNGVSC